MFLPENLPSPSHLPPPPPPPGHERESLQKHVGQQLTGKALIALRMEEFQQEIKNLYDLFPVEPSHLASAGTPVSLEENQPPSKGKTSAPAEESQYQEMPPPSKGKTSPFAEESPYQEIPPPSEGKTSALAEESPYQEMPPPSKGKTSPLAEESPYQEIPPPSKAKTSALAGEKATPTALLHMKKPTPPTTQSPRSPQYIETSPEQALLRKEIKKPEQEKKSAWGAMFRLLGRAAALAPAVVLIPLSYLSLTTSTAILKAVDLARGVERPGRSKHLTEKTQFKKMKARLDEVTFRSDLDVMYHGLRAFGDPREDIQIVAAALLSIVKK